MSRWDCGTLCSSSEELKQEPTKQQQSGLVATTCPCNDIPVNPYDVLQVRRDATLSEIRRSYKRLALWHHPGRTHENREERQRRLQVFEILAACYETLIDPESRRRFDTFRKDLEMEKLANGLPAGEMFVGGRRLKRSMLPNSEDDDRIPPLSRTSTQSSCSSDDDEREVPMHCMVCYPASSGVSSKSEKPTSLVDISSSQSGSDDETEVHYTEAETTRLFGGPLIHLYRVRNFEPFTDSFRVFENVFGSQIFQVDPEEIGRLKEWMPLRPTRKPGWLGSSEKKQDGETTVYTTSRVLHDRRFIRTETVTFDPTSGKAFSFVSVTSQDMELDAEEENENNNTCLVCWKTPTESNVSGMSEFLSGDFHLMYADVVGEFDIFETWTSVFICNRYDFQKCWS